MPDEQGLPSMPGYRLFDPSDPYEMKSGPFFIRDADDGGVEIALVLEPPHCNSRGVVHGGFLMLMADVAVCAAAAHGMPGHQAITVSLSANFMAPGQSGALLQAFPKVTRRTRAMAFVEAKIRSAGETIFGCTAVIRVKALK